MTKEQELLLAVLEAFNDDITHDGNAPVAIRALRDHYESTPAAASNAVVPPLLCRCAGELDDLMTRAKKLRKGGAK